MVKNYTLEEFRERLVSKAIEEIKSTDNYFELAIELGDDQEFTQALQSTTLN